MDVRIVVPSDSFVWEGGWVTRFIPAGMVGARVSTLGGGKFEQRKMKLQANPLTALSIAQGILEYAVISAFKKVFNSGSMKSACRAMTSVVPGLKLEFEL